jgi:excisionase family DNA binding protein
MEIMNVKLYTLEETAKILDTTELTVRTYLKKGKLKGQKIKKRWMISEENIKNFLHG